MENLILELFNSGCIKFGSFVLKSKKTSPIYIDFKEVISYPNILNNVVELMTKMVSRTTSNIICGVPYGGIVYATLISNNLGRNLIIMRKEKKRYGGKKLIEGNIPECSDIAIIEDVMSTGSSVLQSINMIKKEYKDITIKNIFIICDRRANNYNKKLREYNIHSIFNIHDVMNTLLSKRKITNKVFKEVYNFLTETNDFKIDKLYNKDIENENKIKTRLVNIIKSKRTNLCFSADIVNFFDLVKILTKLGKHICILKLHTDTIENFSYEKAIILRKLADEQNFLIFEDRKFCDIGNTFLNQYTKGTFKIVEWADIISVNSLSPGIYDTFSKINRDLDYSKAIIPICDMSNETNSRSDSIAKHNRKNQIMSIVDSYKKDILGIVTQKREDYMYSNNIFYFTPGVNIDIKNDNMDQKYRTPQRAIMFDNCDIIIVGRGIYGSSNPTKQAELYKMYGWSSFQKKI